ncbi:DUF262 domain-containing protein [Listeria newyorkensis]|uniref:DUF262 domain-containing protein n=1 Tax=Listeria newyorkensis TaxID=1497681 RepID=A0A841YTP1_9LIST|nr:DUF262 domain-containing protein [Listeria newyorkensis]MBC1457121.1 DUF262 domain-containing protein [Listeria newyorkensis]
MNDQLITLSKLFSEKIYRIPDYQRGYSWGEKELGDFWGDLTNLKKGKNHYAGVITTERVSEKHIESSEWREDRWLIQSKKYEPFYVVDGQQRLTTSIVLIQAIISVMEEKFPENQLNYTSTQEIQKKFIYEKKVENCSYSYLFGYEPNNASYGYLLKKIYNSPSTLPGNATIFNTKYTENLRTCYEFLCEKIRHLDLSGIEDVYTKITQHFLYNTYSISDEVDVFVTFETMNNRGKKLSNLELLKNRLIYLTTLIDANDGTEERLRGSINECWKSVYDFLGKNQKEMLDDEIFLESHSNLYLFMKDKKRHTEKNSLRIFINDNSDRDGLNTSLLRKVFVPEKVESQELTVQDLFDYTTDLSESVKLWYHINFPMESDFPEEIKEYILKIIFLTNAERKNNWNIIFLVRSVVIRIMYTFFKREEDMAKRIKFIKSLEKAVFLISLGSGEHTMDEKVYFLMEKIIESSNLDELTNSFCSEVKDELKNVKLHAMLIKRYSRQGFYRSEFPILYLLAEYEIFLMKQSKNNYTIQDIDMLYDRKVSSIEHIYPQNAKSEYWSSRFSKFSSTHKHRLRNSMGNLILVTRDKNSRLANKSFPDKKSNNQNTVGFHYGGYAERRLCKYEEWTASEILDRGNELLAFIHDRWGLYFNKKEDRLKFLGLDIIVNEIRK